MFPLLIIINFIVFSMFLFIINLGFIYVIVIYSKSTIVTQIQINCLFAFQLIDYNYIEYKCELSL